jgi:hypothetical protein
MESLCHTAILKLFEFLRQFSKKQKHYKEKLSAELKSLLTKPSNVLPFYTSHQNSNLL